MFEGFVFEDNREQDSNTEPVSSLSAHADCARVAFATARDAIAWPSRATTCGFPEYSRHDHTRLKPVHLAKTISF
jgi:hypothetical protein